MASPNDSQEERGFGPDAGDHPRREWPEDMAGEAAALARGGGTTPPSGESGRPRELAPRQLKRLLSAAATGDAQARAQLQADRNGRDMLVAMDTGAATVSAEERTRDQYWAHAEDKRINDPETFAAMMQRADWRSFYSAEATYREQQAQQQAARPQAAPAQSARAAIDDAYEELLESPDWARLPADEQDALDPSQFQTPGQFTLAVAAAIARSAGVNMGTRGARTSPAMGSGGRQGGRSFDNEVEISAAFREAQRTRRLTPQIMDQMGAILKRYG